MFLQAVTISIVRSCSSGVAWTLLVVKVSLICSWTLAKLLNSLNPGIACPLVHACHAPHVVPPSTLRAISTVKVVPVGVKAFHVTLDDAAITSCVVRVTAGDIRFPVVYRSVKLFHVAISHPSFHWL